MATAVGAAGEGWRGERARVAINPQLTIAYGVFRADLFPFPNPVNEKAARVVAGVVLAGVVVTF